METIGEILTQAINQFPDNQTGTTQDLSIKEIADFPMFLTPGEADKIEIFYLSPAPDAKLCKYCSDPLFPIGRRHLLKREIVAWIGYQECQCDEAIKERENTRLVEEQRQSEEAEAIRKAEFQSRVQKLFDQSKLGAKFKDRTFEAFKITNDNKPAYETALKYATEFERFKKEGIGLNFNGLYGTGKTHLAAAITNDLINRGIPAIMGTTITLLGKFKEAYDKKESESDIIDLYSTIDLLTIDDLGKERVNEWVLEKLYLIINSRYENNLPLVITTNYNIDNLTKRLSTERNGDTAEAITSRLWEMCRGVEMMFEDYRKR